MENRYGDARDSFCQRTERWDKERSSVEVKLLTLNPDISAKVILLASGKTRRWKRYGQAARPKLF